MRRAVAFPLLFTGRLPQRLGAAMALQSVLSEHDAGNTSQTTRFCRCHLDRASLGVTVRKAPCGDSGYQATAYVIDHGIRHEVVNGSGCALVGIGKTPLAAASHLMSALRRRCAHPSLR